MRKWCYCFVDIGLSVLIAVLLTHFIAAQMQEAQATGQQLRENHARQQMHQLEALIEGHQGIIQRSQIHFPVHGEAYAILRNEQRDFTKTVLFGDSEDLLAISIGQYESSGIPGMGKPILLAGHNGTHFKQLRYFEVGDQIQMDTEYGSFVYEVTHTEIMNAADFDPTVLAEDNERLILYCCYPFDSLQTQERYFVYAQKVSGIQIEEDGVWKE
ncbi:MAG: sortase [Erysipelotrichaceae bacterium]|nr:sortase [Erysipelotrichaceae bacterium]MCI9312114.1 sortase [Erysipelotrichaceae bacterium]